MMFERIFPLIENAGGLAFSMDTHRFCVVAAGRRSGKTERMKRKLILRALKGDKFPGPARYAFCAPTYSQVKSVFWSDLKDMCQGLISHISESELFVRLINGSEIHCKGLDKPQRMEGTYYSGLALDEIDDMKPSLWQENLRPMLSDRNGWAIFSGTPNGMGLLYDFSRKALEFPAEWSFHTWPSSEVLPPSEIASAKAELDARSYRQEYEASFENPSGLVYYAFNRDNVRELPSSVDIKILPVYTGIDFNVNPMSAVIFTEFEGCTYVVDEVVIPNNSNTYELAGEIRTRYPDHHIVTFPDPAGAARKTSAEIGISDHTILIKSGFEVFSRRATLSVRDGINAVNSRLCSSTGVRKLFISQKCKTLIKSLERHSYKKGTSIPDDDEYIHCCDALRYPMEFKYPVRDRSTWNQ